MKRILLIILGWGMIVIGVLMATYVVPKAFSTVLVLIGLVSKGLEGARPGIVFGDIVFVVVASFFIRFLLIRGWKLQASSKVA